MSPDTQKYFDAYFTLFSSEGWKVLMEDLEKVLTQAVETTHLLDESKQFYERKGNIHTYKYIINLPAIVENNYNELLAAEKEEEEDATDEEDV